MNVSPNTSRIITLWLFLSTLTAGATGCGLGFRNRPLKADGPSRASFVIGERGGRSDGNLVILATSGRGSRAAYFTAHTMLKLEEEGILDKVDVISAVSGGALPAAYYSLSGDRDLPWNRWRVLDLMSRNYVYYWAFKNVRPLSFCLFWVTDYDRGDQIAEVFDAHIFEGRTFGDLREDRPHLIINATDGTIYEDRRKREKILQDPSFTFTREDFREHLESDINSYPVSHAVTASATFPGLMHHRTLRNYSRRTKKYAHFFDGGIHDTHGLKMTRRVIDANYYRKQDGPDGERVYKNLVVIVVAAHTQFGGTPEEDSDPRTLPYGFFVDNGIFNAFDKMLAPRRKKELRDFDKDCNGGVKYERCTFVQLDIESIKDDDLRRELEQLPYSLNLYNKGQRLIDDAVETLFDRENPFDGQYHRILELKRILGIPADHTKKPEASS